MRQSGCRCLNNSLDLHRLPSAAACGRNAPIIVALRSVGSQPPTALPFSSASVVKGINSYAKMVAAYRDRLLARFCASVQPAATITGISAMPSCRAASTLA